MKSVALAVALLFAGAAASSSSPARPTAVSVPRFEDSSSRLDQSTRERMTGSSWHRGCPVALANLRLLRLTYLGFDGAAHKGRLVVNETVARRVLHAMRSLYRHRFPIRRMRLVDAYGGDDHRSMNADNTSAFNCRFVNGQPGVWSLHAYGKAIDLNPIENPYVTGSGYVSPPAGEPYADRSREAPGMIHAGEATVRAFAAIGWKWRALLGWPKDYQHFSSNGH